MHLLNLAERVAATEGVLARYRDRPFSWADGATCLHLARAQMRAFGHRPPAIPRFRSAIGAQRALAAGGHADLEAMLDALLPRIAPAAMLVGDLALMEGTPPFDAIVLSGGGKVLGWHEDAAGLVPIDAITFKGAWRV